MSLRELELDGALREELQRWAREAEPREACGLLIGRGVGLRARVERATLAHNLSRDPRRFELDPLDQLAAERAAESIGARVLGAWHSHVDTAAVPSPRDRDGDHAYDVSVIVARAHGELRAWSGNEELQLSG